MTKANAMHDKSDHVYSGPNVVVIFNSYSQLLGGRFWWLVAANPGREELVQIRILGRSADVDRPGPPRHDRLLIAGRPRLLLKNDRCAAIRPALSSLVVGGGQSSDNNDDDSANYP